MSVKSKLRNAWSWYATLSGFAVIILALSWGLLHITSVSGPVVEVTEGPKNVTERVPYLGSVRYTFDMRRNASCPGVVVYNLTSMTNHGPPATVTFRRPLKATEIRSYDDIPATVYLPESVFPGRWRFQSSIDSTCPTYKQTDLLVSFEFEVFLPEGNK